MLCSLVVLLYFFITLLRVKDRETEKIRTIYITDTEKECFKKILWKIKVSIFFLSVNSTPWIKKQLKKIIQRDIDFIRLYKERKQIIKKSISNMTRTQQIKRQIETKLVTRGRKLALKTKNKNQKKNTKWNRVDYQAMSL